MTGLVTQVSQDILVGGEQESHENVLGLPSSGLQVQVNSSTRSCSTLATRTLQSSSQTNPVPSPSGQGPSFHLASTVLVST